MTPAEQQKLAADRQPWPRQGNANALSRRRSNEHGYNIMLGYAVRSA